ncbi:PA1136 family autoinducer-binding transcriptional regulator [Dyella japonica]|uniref:LuxR family transcriptional regulator n=1 Tax=Dyella japonica A8 TaxID=1217721 RepID=A0A075K364_9GAMM|nr:PA1136 family autoinducer-binding transcriptional regulator [Dyella japonica]AIF48132.1 LuxR family transcriptional regulator [Dyella japonica A8]
MSASTTELAKVLFEASSRIRRAPTAEAVCGALVEFAKAIGFDRVIVCSVSPRSSDRLVDEIFFVHGDWAEGRSARERDAYLLHCPVTRHVLEFDEPFFWSKSTSSSPDRMVYRIVHSARDLGEVNGIQVPIFGRTGLEGAISFAGEILDMSSDLRLLLQSVCTFAFHEFRRRRAKVIEEVHQQLTEREREILRWTAQGRLQSEVASILSISERTVENHLRSARRRLNASSTAHAVARALALGEIEL